MFSSTKKLDPNLKILLASSVIKEFRVLIKYRNFPDIISKKIKGRRMIWISTDLWDIWQPY